MPAATQDVKRDDAQLVGVSCMWIAAKYEEESPPSSKQLSSITDDTYSTQVSRGEGRVNCMCKRWADIYHSLLLADNQLNQVLPQELTAMERRVRKTLGSDARPITNPWSTLTACVDYLSAPPSPAAGARRHGVPHPQRAPLQPVQPTTN